MSLAVPANRLQSPPYPEVLADAWKAATAERLATAPTVISLFAGGGGSSTGYHMAGYRELLAVDWEKHAEACFEINYPHVPFWQGDVTKLSAEEAMRLSGITGPRQLDLLDGSPPCQGFSTAGKRELYDARNSLFMDYVRLLKALQPRAMVMENVSGMVKGKMKVVFGQALRELKDAGYKVRAWLLNSQWFGVPQARERMIFIGARDDLGIDPVMPKATRTPVCVRDALEGVPDGLEAPSGEFEGAARELWDKMRPGWSGNKVHPLGHFFNFSKANPDRPAPTILKYVSTSGKYAAGLSHWAHPRMLSISEFKRLQSFPDGFEMPGKFADQWARIGNSVPPLMMRAVAAHVRRTILDA